MKMPKALVGLRRLDVNAWRLFSRKAGAMRHRLEKRQEQRSRRDIAAAMAEDKE